MGQVGIHLDDHVRALVERAGDAGNVGAAQTVLLGAVQHTHRVREFGGQFVGNLAGAVR